VRRIGTKFLRGALLCGALALALAATNVASAGAKFIYIANMNQGVRAFAVNAATGALTPVSGGPWIVDEFPFSMAISPNGKSIYVVNPSSSDIAGFSSNVTSGALTPIPGSPFPVAPGNGAIRMIVHPNGKFAYANATAYDIERYNVDQTTGALTASGNPAVGGIFGTLAIDPSGKFLYSANGGLSFLPDPAKTNNVSAFTINAATGALTEIAGSPFPTGTGPRRLTTDPSGKYLLVSNTDSHDIRVYAINVTTGALAQVGSKVSTAGLNFDIRFEPSGKFVYVSFGDLKKVSIYSFNSASGALAKVADVGTGRAASLLGVDPSGKFLFVEELDTTTFIATYTINAATGALTLASGPTLVDGDTGVVGMVVAAQ
jgi:6-phosphogluconolactonase